MVQFEILGTLRVVTESGPCDVRGRLRRSLLLRLLISANQVVPAEKLADDLWAGRPPPGVASTLRSHVSLLRQAVGTQRILGGEGGYQVIAGGDELDTVNFVSEVEAGRSALARGDAVRALQLLSRGLERWRGTPLADVSDADWSRSERARLGELYDQAVEDAIDGRLVLGEHNEVVAVVRSAVDAAPLRERRWAQLMLALYRGGRQADALRAYQELRARLREDLGIEPSPELDALEGAILLHKPELDWVPPTTSGSLKPRSGPDQANVSGPVRLPPRLSLAPVAGVVARDAELTQLAHAFKRVAAGEGREVVLVSGEPGLGKTTLVAEYARRAFANGACVLLGRCDEDLRVSYAPFAEALGYYIEHGPADVLRAFEAAHGTELVAGAPTLASQFGSFRSSFTTDPDSERYQLYRAVTEFLALISSVQPLVLVLEDLQWSDDASLRLLRYLVTTAGLDRILVLVTFRAAAVLVSEPLTEVLGVFRGEPALTRIELENFDTNGVLALMEAMVGQSLKDDGARLARVVYRETEGNPFFTIEVLQSLLEAGAIYQNDDDHWVAEQNIPGTMLPSSVREVVGSRVARLGSGATDILSIAAVIGADFDFTLLSATSRFDHDHLLRVLDAATGDAIVREAGEEPGRWTFSHSLIQEALYQGLGATRRALIHRRVAECLESICGEDPGNKVGELAYHWLNATRPIATGKVAGYFRMAAEEALTGLAPDDAVRYFTHALHLAESGDPLERCDVLIGLGTAQRQAGIAAFRETLLEAAATAVDLKAYDRTVRATLQNNRGFFASAGFVDSERVQMLEVALESLRGEPGAEQVLLLATLCCELSFGPFERRRNLADRAKSLAEAVNDPTVGIRVSTLIHDPLSVPTTLTERLELSGRAFERARALNNQDLLFFCAVTRREDAGQSGDFALAEECLGTMRTVSESLRQPMMKWVTAMFEAGQALVTGDPEHAEELASAALAIGIESGQPDAYADYETQLITVRLQQGRLGELIPLVQDSLIRNPGLPMLQATLAIGHLQRGDREPALRLLDHACESGFALLPFDLLWLHGVGAYAQVALELRAAEPALTLFQLLSPYVNQIPYIGSGSLEPVSFHLGALASLFDWHEEAEVYFAKAMDLSTRGRMKYAEARTRVEWGRMLCSRGEGSDVDRPRSHLDLASSIAANNGYRIVEERAVAVRAELG